MKTTKSIITILAITVISILSSLINNGCGNENVIGYNNSENRNFGMLLDSITVEVTKQYEGYNFNLKNRTTCTIVNDFHVQFDTTVVITEWSLAWQSDANTTNLKKGKIGEKTVGRQPPVQPNQSRDLLWVKIQYTGKKKIKTYKWQATKDGVVVQSGSGTLPD